MVDLHVANPLCSSSLQNSKCWVEAEAGAELDEPGLDVAGTLVEEVEVFPDARPSDAGTFLPSLQRKQSQLPPPYVSVLQHVVSER